mgnify:CR=1 FL=1
MSNGSLIKLVDTTLSSAVSSVSLGASDWDTSFDVYLVTTSGVTVSASNTVDLQFLTSGSADTSSNYDSQAKNLYSGGSFSNNYSTNTSDIPFGNTITNTSNYSSSAEIYLFNFNEASEYSYCTYSETAWNSTSVGRQGSAVLTVAQANNGVLIKAGTGNLTAGRFQVFGIVK